MASHHETRLLPYPAEFLFELVADVESYPHFLPMWKEARIYKRTEDGYCTEQVIGRGPVRERFRSCTVLKWPEAILVTSTDGIFTQFSIDWNFESMEPGACRVTFALTCKAGSRLLDRLFDVMLMEMGRSTVSAFERRAGDLYRKDAKSEGST